MGDSNTLAQVPARGRAIIFAPFASDAPVLDGMLASHGIATEVCDSFPTLLARLDDDALFVVLTEEAFGLCDTQLLLEKLNQQPHWSDIPFVGLIGSAQGPQQGKRVASLSQIANITVLERPVSGEALMMLIRTALRARLLQYRIREQFEELGQYSRELEQRVDARTAALGREIEERKRMEAALNESRRLESLGRLTGGIAHDFNNMLQVVAGSVELIRAVAPNSDARIVRALDSISRASRNGAKLTQQLLAYARHQPLQNSAIDLLAHVQVLSDLIRHSLGRRITLALDVAPDLWSIRADLTQLDVAVLNLVFNARDAMAEGGVVTLAMANCVLPDGGYPEAEQLTGDFVRVSLSDQGTGMSADTAERAFEPFFTTKALGQGTGLGLSQVQGFARQSGGLAFLRALPVGTMVGMFLPRAADGVAGAALGAAPAGIGTVRGKRVLCVEDHYEVMAVARAILDRLETRVIPAASADEALAVSLDSVDVVFSDVMMPGSMDGIELAQTIRRTNPSMPIVLASGYILDPGRLAELDVTFVQKPYTASDVEEAINAEIAKRGFSLAS